MKKKFIYFFIVLSILLVLLVGCGNNNENSYNTASAARLSSETNITNTTNTAVSTNNQINTTINEIHVAEHDVREEELASFSTKLGGKNTARSRNIGITTSTLNGTCVENRSNIFFL